MLDPVSPILRKQHCIVSEIKTGRKSEEAEYLLLIFIVKPS